MKMQILGTGRALPERIMTNDDIAKNTDTNDEWIVERTGISTRHISEGESVADLAIRACQNALENAGKSASEVELIIVATCSPEMALPCVACQVQAGIGAKNAVAFDLNAACSGYLFALNSAYAYFKSGIYKNALIVGAEVLSKIVDWTDRGTCILFGDGAGASFVTATASDADNYMLVQHADGNKGMVLSCGNRDINNPFHNEKKVPEYVTMDGREIFKFAVSQIPVCINEVLGKAGLTVEDIDYFMLHQANLRIASSIAKKLSVDMEKVPVNVMNVGNMSSASIPVLLDECNRKGMLKRGMKLVLSGFGAGLTFGASVIEW